MAHPRAHPDGGDRGPARLGGRLPLSGGARHGGVDRQGRPIGTDFSNVYAAGIYVLEGNFQAPFDWCSNTPRASHLRRGDAFYGWHYPPYFLFVAAALAWMPYGLALFVWQAISSAFICWRSAPS